MPLKETTKVTLNLSHELLEEVDGTAARLDVTRSDLIRTAVTEYTRRVREEILKKELMEEYKANADLLRQTSEDFKYVDGENV